MKQKQYGDFNVPQIISGTSAIMFKHLLSKPCPPVPYFTPNTQVFWIINYRKSQFSLNKIVPLYTKAKEVSDSRLCMSVSNMNSFLQLQQWR